MAADHQTAELQQSLDRLLAGEQLAGPELVSLAFDRLRILARSMLASYSSVARWEQTDDVLQNSALRLCRALEAVQPPTLLQFFGLAALQIRRELIDLARHHCGPQGHGAHELTNDAPDAAGPAGQEFADPTDGPLTLVEWTDFHRLIQELPAEDREVFDLLYYHGLTQEQAAQVLAVAVRTVKRRWRSARLALGDALEGTRPGG